MLILENYVEIAIEKAGGATKVSNACRVSNACCYKWIKARRVPDLDKAKILSKLSKIPVERIRP